MREIDFLPSSFHAIRRRRREMRRNVLMAAGLVLCLGGLHGLNTSRIRSAEASLNLLHSGVEGVQTAQQQLKFLHARTAELSTRADLLARLEDDAPLDAVIGELTGLMSESMSIRSLEVDARPPAAEPKAPASRQATATPPPPVTRAKLTGVAATDVEVGMFLGKLSSCPIFADVNLEISREARLDGRRLREFEVRFTVRPIEVEQ
jgi:hypothetical protein